MPPGIARQRHHDHGWRGLKTLFTVALLKTMVNADVRLPQCVSAGEQWLKHRAVGGGEHKGRNRCVPFS